MLTLTLVWRDPPGDTIHNKLHSRLLVLTREKCLLQMMKLRFVIMFKKYQYQIQQLTNAMLRSESTLPKDYMYYQSVRQDYTTVLSNC